MGSVTQHRLLWRFLLVIGTIMYGMYSPLVHMSRIDGQIPFSSVSVVLHIELFKLIASLVMYVVLGCRGLVALSWPRIREVLPFIVPALLYAFNNNASVWMQAEMDPTTFQVLGNLKILATAILYRVIMKRALTRQQWLALGLLVVAATIDSASSVRLSSATAQPTQLPQQQQQPSHLDLHITLLGIILMLIYCFVSGFASVYNEYIMKAEFESSIHLQNIYQYVFGLLINGAAWWLHRDATSVAADAQQAKGIWHELYTGFTLYTWIIVFTQVFCGLLMSVILKHSDNIARLFLICFSMLVTAVASAALFNLRLSAGFVFDVLLLMLALALYMDVISLQKLRAVLTGNRASTDDRHGHLPVSVEGGNSDLKPSLKGDFDE